jgi:general secretion pathway protein F/type IV pilus assembly protein PilC
MKLRLPILGKILRMVSVCQFCRILGTLLRSGVPILQALRISQDSVANRMITAEIERATESVRQGETLAGPLAEGNEFPRDIVDMIGIAEESNSLDTVLVQIADTNEVRTARNIEIAVRILEPVLLMAMAGMVLVIALALLVPILSMSQHAL